jgi:hypothetical protein
LSNTVLGSLLVSSIVASCFFGASGGIWRGGVVWGDFREWTCGGEHYWGACSVGRFWRGAVVWGGFREWGSRGCVYGGFLGGGVVFGGF